MVNWSMSENFINSSGSTATIVKGLYDNVGGSWFATISLIILFVILIAVIMRIPMELTAIFIIPLLLVCFVYVPDFLSVLGVALLYVGVIVGKNILFER